MKGVFVTGTDTDCGKTRVAAALIHRLRAAGLRVAPFKPVAAGAVETSGGLRNEDAIALIEAAGGEWSYEEVNPYCFRPPVSPHLAAADAGVTIRADRIQESYSRLAGKVDMVVVEGAGGWLVPLRPDWSIEDLAVMLDLPVVLVVGLRLGCLNHARLSASQIQLSGVRLAGWIGSVVDPDMRHLQENTGTLRDLINAPCLGVLPHLGPSDRGEHYLDLGSLMAFPG